MEIFSSMHLSNSKKEKKKIIVVCYKRLVVSCLGSRLKEGIEA